LDIAIMRIVFSGVDYGSYHSELKIPVLRIEIWGRVERNLNLKEPQPKGLALVTEA
jgi:hypothetical protein